MYLRDIISTVKSQDVIGSCNDDYVFSIVSDAQSLVANMGIMDPSVGVMSICAHGGCMTLPADVETVLAINQDGHPTVLRDEWFEYHINGTGSGKWTSFGYTDVIGYVSTFRDPEKPVIVVAQSEDAKDSGKEFRVFGWDKDGKRIYSKNASGDMEDGFIVEIVHGFSIPNYDVPPIAIVDRITKPVTSAYVKLLGYSEDFTHGVALGNYRPDETEPRYVRIKTSCKGVVKVKYRKKNLEVKSLDSWINVDNKEVLILAIKAVFNRRKNNFDLATQAEAEASRILSMEAEAKRPPGALRTPQIVYDFGCDGDHDDRLFYRG